VPGTAFTRGPLLLVYALSRQSGQLMSRCFEGAPLTPEEFAVYSSLRLVQPATPSALAATLGMKQPTLSNHLRRMQQRRHVRRRAHPHDGRSSIVSLTPLGQELTEACFPHFQDAILPLVERLGSDKDRILGAMEELSEALDAVLADLDAAGDEAASGS
jgi:DNA-binding MarR family transcriptional regulator